MGQSVSGEARIRQMLFVDRKTGNDGSIQIGRNSKIFLLIYPRLKFLTQ